MKKPATKRGKDAKMAKTMHEFKHGKLHSGSKDGPKVKNRKQAVAIGLNQSGKGSAKKREKRLEGKEL